MFLTWKSVFSFSPSVTTRRTLLSGSRGFEELKTFQQREKKSTVAGQQTASVEQSAVNGFAQGLSDGLLVEGIALVIYHPLLYFTDLARDSKGCGHNPPNTALITDPRHEVVK